jgi:hypothetical protein
MIQQTETATIAPTAPTAPTETATIAPTETATIAPTETATIAPTETEITIAKRYQPGESLFFIQRLRRRNTWKEVHQILQINGMYFHKSPKSLQSSFINPFFHLHLTFDIFHDLFKTKDPIIGILISQSTIHYVLVFQSGFSSLNI